MLSLGHPPLPDTTGAGPNILNTIVELDLNPLEVGQEAPMRPSIRMAYIIARSWSFPTNLAYL